MELINVQKSKYFIKFYKLLNLNYKIYFLFFIIERFKFIKIKFSLFVKIRTNFELNFIFQEKKLIIKFRNI
jgi:hypothetical protein